MNSKTMISLYSMYMDSVIRDIHKPEKDTNSLPDIIQSSVSYGQREVIRAVLKCEFGNEEGKRILEEWKEQSFVHYGRRNGEKIFIKNFLTDK